MNENVVHIDSDISFVNQFAKDEVHHRLECSRGVREAEEHDHRLEQASIGFECGFPLISIANANIVIPPSNIKFHKECRSATVHSCEMIHEFSY